jgi:zinc protease
MTNTAIDRALPPVIQNGNNIQVQEPELHRLSNGIPLYCFGNKSYDAMRLDLVFEAGSVYQDKILVAGTSNKMLREGTSKLSSQSLSARLDYHGSYIDLSMDKDTAWLSLFCLQRNFYYLLPIIKSMVVSPRFSERDFSMINNKQKNAFAVNRKKPKHLARNLFNRKLFGEATPYGQTAEVDDFDKLRVDDLPPFHQKFYHHANCRMIASGPVDKSIIQKIEMIFGDSWGVAGPVGGIDHSIDFKPDNVFFNLKGSLQSAIYLGKPIINREHPDFAKLVVLNTILGGYFGSRLMSNIREDKGYTYGIYSQLVTLKNAAFLQISTEAGKAVEKATIAEINNELKRLCEEEVPAAELELVKNYLYGQFLRSLDGPYALAERFKSVMYSEGSMEYYAKTMKTIQQTEATELLRLAQNWLQPDSMLMVVVGEE